MSYFLLLMAGLAGFWLLLSGFWDNGLLLTFGALSVIFTAWFGLRIEQADPRRFRLTIVFRLPIYLVWLTVEIVKANIDVLKRILKPEKYPISPTFVRLPSSQKTTLGKAIYANSITLTPGTVSVEVTDDDILIHALSHDAAEDLKAGEMDRRVTATEGGSL